MTFLIIIYIFPLKFIDFKIGAESGYIRFEEPEGAQKARAAAVLAQEGGLSVKNFIAVLEPVTGMQQRTFFPYKILFLSGFVWVVFCILRHSIFA